MNLLAETLKKQRIDKNLTLAVLGEIAHVSKSDISAFERGLKMPSETVLKKIAKSLELSFSALKKMYPPIVIEIYEENFYEHFKMLPKNKKKQVYQFIKELINH